MKQKDAYTYAIAALGLVVTIVLVRRYIGRNKIKRLKEQETDPNEKVADVQTNFDNNPNGENW